MRVIAWKSEVWETGRRMNVYYMNRWYVSVYVDWEGGERVKRQTY